MTVRTLSRPLDRFDPLAAWLHLGARPPGFCESAMAGGRIGRYSILPLRATACYRLDDTGLRLEENGTVTLLSGPPWPHLAGRLRRAAVPATDSIFPGGFFGLFAYDLAGRIETLPRRARRDLPVPELLLYWVDQTAVYDHHDRRLHVASLDPDCDLESLTEAVLAAAGRPLPAVAPRVTRPRPVMPAERFHAMVTRGKDYIAAGDIYQANLSCRFDSRIEGPVWPLYRELRRINPSPFACLLHSPRLELVSASPERLVKLDGALAETRPIAGTRPRGYTPPEDERLGRELLGHPKERAEHIMLVDLERNDLGKVCRIGSVEVDELMVLERYSHVTHIVSNVRGHLRPERGPFDLVRAMFPGGTITGVPKKRCMEIIDELEPVGRGSYTGSVGYLSVSGRLDLNILIRGFQRLGDHLSYQTGAGIVADSDPDREWQECLGKGRALNLVLERFAC